jgi:uncharacterized damage-inducible protein DinB
MPLDRSIIDKYQSGGEQLALSIRGLTREDLLAVPTSGKWSTQQVVIHLLDSDLISADRMKRTIAEENPSLLGYDESKFVQNLFYNEQDATQAVKVVDLNRKLFAAVLRKLPDAAFERAATHNERGRLTLAQQLTGAVNHLEHHLKFIHEKRAAMGKEMW